jgi:uncharacterized protein with PQ loop repeat
VIELIGWIGAIAFATCAIPQAWQSYKTKSSDGVSWLFLILWLLGEVLTIIYVCLTTMDLILLFNYLFNLTALLIIMYYKGIKSDTRRES